MVDMAGTLSLPLSAADAGLEFAFLMMSETDVDVSLSADADNQYWMASESSLEITSHVFNYRPIGSSVQPYPDPAPPAMGSDTFASAPSVSLAPGGTYQSLPTDTTPFTKESGESSVSYRTAWWKYTPVVSGSAVFDTGLSTAIAGSTDTYLYVYTGSAVNAVTYQGSDDDGGAQYEGGNPGTSAVFLAVTAGVTYRISCGSYGNYGIGQVLRVTGPTTMQPPPVPLRVPIGLALTNHVYYRAQPMYSWLGLSVVVDPLDSTAALKQLLSASTQIDVTLTNRGGFRVQYAVPENAAVETRLYAKDGWTFLGVLANARNVKWLDQISNPGTASFELPLSDPLLELITDRCIVKFLWHGKERFGCVINTENCNLTASEGYPMVAFESQLGLLSLLADALVYPEYGVRAPDYLMPGKAPKDRNFGFMSEAGSWFVSTQWPAAVGGQPWPTDPTGRRGSPSGLANTDKLSQWISAAPGPTVHVAPGVKNYLRQEFTLDEDQDVLIYVSFDNAGQFFLDGELVFDLIPDLPRQWMTAQHKAFALTAGKHTLAARVDNAVYSVAKDGAGTIARTPAGPSSIAFICDVVFLSKESGIVEPFRESQRITSGGQFTTISGATLSAAGITKLNAIVKLIKVPAPWIQIEGHFSRDAGGADLSASAARAITLARCNSVKAYLLSKIPLATFTTTSYGYDKTLAVLGDAWDIRQRRMEVRYPKGAPVDTGDVWSANVITRSDSSWKATATEPGWFRAQVLKRLFEEAKQRGVAGCLPLTIGFYDNYDSYLAQWEHRGQYTFPVASSSLLDIVQTLTESQLDVGVDAATMRLNAWVRRGRDRTQGDAAIRLYVGGTLTDVQVTRTAPSLSHVVVAQQDGTFITFTSDNAASVGRIETSISLGSVLEDATAQAVVDDMLLNKGHPSVSVTGKTSSLIGAQPYVDYELGDTVIVPGNRGTTLAARVIAITVDASADVVKCYPEVMLDETSPYVEVPYG